MYSVCHVAINTLVKVLTKKHINFVDVKQMCSQCGHQRSSNGKVNPHIRDTPAASYCLQPFYSEGLHLEIFLTTCELPASVTGLSITTKSMYSTGNTLYLGQKAVQIIG